MALEDIFVVLQLFNDGSQGCMNLHARRLVFFQIANGDIVLLCLDIKQVVNGNRKVVSTDICIVNSYRDVFLLFRRITQQLFHPVSQTSVVINADRQYGHDDTDDERPIEEQIE
jgi:hypothetical protein